MTTTFTEIYDAMESAWRRRKQDDLLVLFAEAIVRIRDKADVRRLFMFLQALRGQEMLQKAFAARLREVHGITPFEYGEANNLHGRCPESLTLVSKYLFDLMGLLSPGRSRLEPRPLDLTALSAQELANLNAARMEHNLKDRTRGLTKPPFET